MVKPKAKKVVIKEIRVDKELYPRTSLSKYDVIRYTQAIKCGVKFPNIVVATQKGKSGYTLVDGAHRLQATKYAGGKPKTIVADVFENLTDKEIYVLSIKYNDHHGKPFSIQERLSIADKLLKYGVKMNEVGLMVQMTPQTINRLNGSRMVNTVTGEVIMLKPELVNVVDTSKTMNIEESAELETMQNSFQGRNQLDLVNTLLTLAQNKMLDVKNVKVKYLLKELRTELNKLKL